MKYAFAILGFWMISFLFSGIEAGLLSINPVRLRNYVKQGNRSAMRLDRLTRRPERLLITVLLITNMADICGLLLLTKILVSSLGFAGFLWSILIALPIYLFVLSVLPKALFRRFPFRALAALGGLLEVISIILWPILEIGGLIGRFFLPRRISAGARLFVAREELKQIAVQGEREGAITSAERAMIHNVVDFRSVKASDVMIPISKAITVQPETPVMDVVQLSATAGVDRFPIISQGQPLGIVNVFDILIDDARRESLAAYTRRIVTAAENEPAYRIIQRMRAARLGLAAVLDSKKQLVGIVTGEEIIKRLVQVGAL
ncbi:MAG TPA: CNNM domain-containing protein [Chthoniobacterales bacterium]|nr:CNNM domain-containing protein [Chthoniobacterales bacterium]